MFQWDILLLVFFSDTNFYPAAKAGALGNTGSFLCPPHDWTLICKGTWTAEFESYLLTEVKGRLLGMSDICLHTRYLETIVNSEKELCSWLRLTHKKSSLFLSRILGLLPLKLPDTGEKRFRMEMKRLTDWQWTSNNYTAWQITLQYDTVPVLPETMRTCATLALDVLRRAF